MEKREVGRAREALALADGGKWIWNMVQDRWLKARQLLDWFHASEHLNALAILRFGEGPRAKDWWH